MCPPCFRHLDFHRMIPCNCTQKLPITFDFCRWALHLPSSSHSDYDLVSPGRCRYLCTHQKPYSRHSTPRPHRHTNYNLSLSMTRHFLSPCRDRRPSYSGQFSLHHYPYCKFNHPFFYFDGLLSISFDFSIGFQRSCSRVSLTPYSCIPSPVRSFSCQRGFHTVFCLKIY